MTDDNETTTPTLMVSLHMSRDTRDRLKVLAAKCKMTMQDLIQGWVAAAEARAAHDEANRQWESEQG